MTSRSSPTNVEKAAACLLEHFGPHVAALIGYGSRVFGQARAASSYDFWLIVRDPAAFHRGNAEFYRTRLNIRSTPEEQTALNETGPLFYSLEEAGLDIKLAVLGEATLLRLCRDEWWTVKGRLQKPLLILRSTPTVDAAILSARRDGLACALNLVPREFTLEELLREVVGLSYRAEVRPEHKRAKIRSILKAGREELEKIYAPLLAELEYVEPRGAQRYLDTRDPEARRRARRATLRALRRSKWSRKSLGFIWRNYKSHGAPFRYISLKVLGEIEKVIRRWLHLSAGR